MRRRVFGWPGASREESWQALGLCALVLLWMPLVFARHLVGDAAALVELASSPNPYLVRSHAGLLYAGVPVVLVSACVALMTPGLLLTWRSRFASFDAWIVRAFALTVVVVSAATAVVQALVGRPLVGEAFVLHLALLSLACAAVGVRTKTAADVRPSGAANLSARVLILVVPVLVCAALAPKFLWESFNGDGAHAMASARMAVTHAWPFWDPHAGTVAMFPGMSTMLFAFPASWFVRLFGDVEVSVRAPYLLVLAVTHAGLMALATVGRPDLSRAARPLLWLALVTYSVVQAFSATYDPYSADLAMPGLPDTLQMAVFLGFAHAYVDRRWGWAVLCLVLTLTSSPAGPLLAVFWIFASAWTGGRSDVVRSSGALVALGLLLVGLALMPRVLVLAGAHAPGDEHGLLGLLKRFAFLQFTDWRRLVWVVVPSGLLPAFAWLAWPRLDHVARVVVVVSAAYFLMFFVQAHVMIHHFVPAMLLPLVAWWRIDDRDHPRVAAARLWVTAAAGGLALWISIPAQLVVITAARDVGATIDDGGRAFSTLDPRAFRRLELLGAVLPTDAEADVPAKRYGGSPLAWGYYASRARTAAPSPVYMLRDAADAAGALALSAPAASNDVGTLVVLDPTVWASHLSLRPPTPPGSRAYWTPRGVLFRGVPMVDGPRVLDVPAVIRSAGVNLDWLTASH